jgi:hypothetical protein
MSQTRRLAAILAADVAGYSRLMGADEEGTLERLKALRRELLHPNLPRLIGAALFPKIPEAAACRTLHCLWSNVRWSDHSPG